MIIGGVIVFLVILAGAFFIILPMMDESAGTATPYGTLFNGLQGQSTASSAVHGTITTGSAVVAATGTIGQSGGTITVSQPGSAINGLKFEAPAGAYPSGQQVTISSAPVTGTTFGSNFNPATPMIEINAGKAYAEEPVLVTIPVNIPDDQFAMAFYYDETTKQLEGIPLVGEDSKSITITTRHFSDIIVSMIDKGTLDGINATDSGFRPGVDDWEFSNSGSIAAKGGHCAGQSLSMMWYYTEQQQRTGAPHLYGLFDNNGREKTPTVELDNTLGYRFASMVQKNINWRNNSKMEVVLRNVSDTTTFRLFKYSILLTGSPQHLGIYRNGGGHAIVCYRVEDDTLYVADPNYPGKERTIALKAGVLGPYASGENAQDIAARGASIYPKIVYGAKSAMISWPEIAALYDKFRDGSIGAGTFPIYMIKIQTRDETGKNKTIGIEGGKNPKPIPLEVNEKKINFALDDLGFPDLVWIKTLNGKRLINDSGIELNEGKNTVSIELFQENTQPDGTINYDWVGFDWLEIDYIPKETPTPTPLQATRFLTTARGYEASSTWRSDPDCHMENLYADSNCVPVTTKGTRLRILPYCGSPPAKCINPAVNNGIAEELTYYTETDNSGSTPVIIPVVDGWWTHYDSSGISYKDWFEDGRQAGSCTRYSTGFDCYGETN